MGQAILPKLLRCIEETNSVTIMMQVIKHRIQPKGLLFPPKPRHAAHQRARRFVTILSAESAAIYNFLDARYFKALFALDAVWHRLCQIRKKQKGDECDEDRDIIFGSLASSR